MCEAALDRKTIFTTTLRYNSSKNACRGLMLLGTNRIGKSAFDAAGPLSRLWLEQPASWRIACRPDYLRAKRRVKLAADCAMLRSRHWGKEK